MTTTKLSGSIRLFLAFTSLGVAGWFGYQHTHPWIIVVLGLVFTPLYVTGKWQHWKLTWQHRGFSTIVKALIGTLPVQIILAGL